jgi:hypothetical protein
MRLAAAMQIDQLNRDLAIGKPRARGRREVVRELVVELVEDVAIYGLGDAEFHTVVPLGMYHLQHRDTVEAGFDNFFENAAHATLTPYFSRRLTKTPDLRHIDITCGFASSKS